MSYYPTCCIGFALHIQQMSNYNIFWLTYKYYLQIIIRLQHSTEPGKVLGWGDHDGYSVKHGVNSDCCTLALLSKDHVLTKGMKGEEEIEHFKSSILGMHAK